MKNFWKFRMNSYIARLTNFWRPKFHTSLKKARGEEIHVILTTLQAVEIRVHFTVRTVKYPFSAALGPCGSPVTESDFSATENTGQESRKLRP